MRMLGAVSSGWSLDEAEPSIRLGSWSGRVSVPKVRLDGDAVTAEDAVNFAIFAIRDALHVNGWTDEHPEEVDA